MLKIEKEKKYKSNIENLNIQQAIRKPITEKLVDILQEKIPNLYLKKLAMEQDQN